LNANGLEIKQRVQRGMAFYDLTIIFAIAEKNSVFRATKWDLDFGEKCDIRILVKNTIFAQFFILRCDHKLKKSSG